MSDIQKIYDGYFERMKDLATTLKFLKDTMSCFEYEERQKLETLIKCLSKELEELAVNIAETGSKLIKQDEASEFDGTIQVGGMTIIPYDAVFRKRYNETHNQGHGEICTGCKKTCNTFSARAGDLPTAIFHSDGTGIVKWYCLECVTTKMGV